MENCKSKQYERNRIVKAKTKQKNIKPRAKVVCHFWKCGEVKSPTDSKCVFQAIFNSFTLLAKNGH